MNSDTAHNKIWIIFAILIIIIPAGIWFAQEQPGEILNPHVETASASSQTPLPTIKAKPQPFNSTALSQQIEKIITEQTPAGKEWVFGIAIEDPLTGQKYGKNQSEAFDAASTAKLPILTLLYEQIVQKKISEDEKITINAADIKDYGTGTIRYKKTPVTYTVRELAELMIKQSDNTAASVLAEKVGRTNLADYVKKIGMNNTDIPENTTTPHDLNIMLAHIYTMKETDPATAGTMIKIMTDSAFETRLPALLPEDAIIAHKIGTGTAQIHDVGIGLLEKRPYLISVFTKKINDEKQAEKIIAMLSRAVYDEFKSLEQ
ncbi:MAG: class A beta-lactamase-related serine hydrolase [bacterium]|nr:class A beta-lactamase-related serine hydrolase [bacterium]